MKNKVTNKPKSKPVDAITALRTDSRPNDIFTPDIKNGLAHLQQSTVTLMNQENHNWGFGNSRFAVRRQKLDNDIWKITIEDPKTREIILEAVGNGDKVFACEDSLARMAELLTEKGIKITSLL